MFILILMNTNDIFNARQILNSIIPLYESNLFSCFWLLQNLTSNEKVFEILKLVT